MTFTKQEDGKYQLEDGRVVSRAELIRELFNTDWHRRDIAKELDVPYNVVFQATANMTNKHHQPGRGGVAVAKTVTLPDGTEMPRAEYIRQEVAKGRSKAEIAKELGVSYSVVWNATKGMSEANKTQRHYVELPDGTKMPRTEYIRKRFAEGATRREIANELGCDYTVVWQATRTLKKDESVANDANDAENTQTPSNIVGGGSESSESVVVGDGDVDVNFPE
jgi:hypothetical protein